MTTKMTRRTFLKGAAAAAAAVSLSGLLTGCGGDQLADNEVQIGAYTVKVYGLDVDQGTEMNKARHPGQGEAEVCRRRRQLADHEI